MINQTLARVFQQRNRRRQINSSRYNRIGAAAPTYVTYTSIGRGARPRRNGDDSRPGPTVERAVSRRIRAITNRSVRLRGISFEYYVTVEQYNCDGVIDLRPVGVYPRAYCTRAVFLYSLSPRRPTIANH